MSLVVPGDPTTADTGHTDEGESNGSASIPSAFYNLLRFTESQGWKGY